MAQTKMFVRVQPAAPQPRLLHQWAQRPERKSEQARYVVSKQKPEKRTNQVREGEIPMITRNNKSAESPLPNFNRRPTEGYRKFSRNSQH